MHTLLIRQCSDFDQSLEALHVGTKISKDAGCNSNDYVTVGEWAGVDYDVIEEARNWARFASAVLCCDAILLASVSTSCFESITAKFSKKCRRKISPS